MKSTFFQSIKDLYFKLALYPFHVGAVALAVVVIGFVALPLFANAQAQVKPATSAAQSQRHLYDDFVHQDYYRKVGLTYQDYLNAAPELAMGKAGVVKVKGQAITDADGVDQKRGEAVAAGRKPINIIAISEEDAATCGDHSSCTQISSKALAILNEKLGELERAQKKGAACI